VDPATGAPRLVTDSGKVFDPVAGGEALVVIDVNTTALFVFTDPATGRRGLLVVIMRARRCV
jgi:hypothetical protein